MWLWGSIAARASSAGSILDTAGSIELSALSGTSSLTATPAQLAGRSVLVRTQTQLATALTLIELDGIVRRLVLCPPDLPDELIPEIRSRCAAQCCVSEEKVPGFDGDVVTVGNTLVPLAGRRRQQCETEWVLLTSGTTGGPKLVVHTLSTLTNAFTAVSTDERIVWSTFYDIRRYGGLQILLRGVLCGSLLLSSPRESSLEFLARAGAHGVTHISGTPSHWRSALMSGAASSIRPRYVRLSGEIADQGILDALRAAFPDATVAHAFASTEAGVGFEVQDGRAGIPDSLVRTPGREAEMDVSGPTLRLRSGGNALRYLDDDAPSLKDPDGFVNTGDLLEHRDGRYYFVGRTGGVINVGGLKVHPEEIEAVINAHPLVHMSLVRARRNPITGAIVTADVVLKEAGVSDAERLRSDLQDRCRRALAPYKVPATIRIVASLELTPAGKLVRNHA